jgi:hypothetical protein
MNIINFKNMLSKLQKNWLWVFGLMFLIPEILFSTLLSSIINYSKYDFLTLSSIFFDKRFFINNPFFFYSTLIIELLGLFGLLIISIKNKKILYSLIIFMNILWFLFLFFLEYITNNINPVF